MAQQSHCLLLQSGKAHSHSKHHSSTSVVPPRDHPMHSDSSLLKGDLLSNRDNRQALIESPHPSCSGWQGSGASLSPGPDSALLGSEKQDWPPQGP
ncbi:hypothetical protein E2C01_053279 [Portunus trituberculatus]|uniref:Uncharacterized protein n=1 Tax=Portunus trituberculatus TaxID=210409 RepID=A0A5B7GNX4_PORTR|nr:hypothetical protein [Portunus trituberculatus]